MMAMASILRRLSRTASEFEETTLSGRKREKVEGHILAGPNSCGKTSLLFEYAFSCAEQGENVLYIAPKPLTRLPLFVNGRKQPKDEFLTRINMVYLSDYAEIIEYFSGAHLDEVRNASQGQSRHVLLDNFDWYFQEKGTRTEETTRFANCMAYIIDAMDFWLKNMQSSPETGSHFLLAMSDDSMIGIDKLGLYKHWITDFIKIQKIGNSFFKMQVAELGKNCCSSEQTLCYNIEENAIKVTQGES